jgi:glycosyltransferase involved in cell wall biosynthesis
VKTNITSELSDVLKENYRFSVIVPVLNRVHCIDRCIRSILSQKIPSEIIVIDGGSTDGTLEKIAAYNGSLAYTETGLDEGIANAFNRGIKQATGDWIAILNSDDWWEPNTLTLVSEAIGSDDFSGVIHGSCRLHSERESYIKIPNLDDMSKYMSAYHSTIFCHREAYAFVGGYDESYGHAMDSEWTHRAMALDVDFRAAHDVLANMEMGGISDLEFSKSLKEYRNSVLVNGIAGPIKANFYYLLHMLVKLAYSIPGFYQFKRFVDRQINKSVEYSDVPRLSTTPSISLVTPSYNQGEFIGRTINSVLSQNYSSFDYTIYDAESGDETSAILGHIEDKMVTVFSEPDKGQADAISKGFNRTKGEIVGWLNSDDVLMPGTLEYVADYFQRNPNIDAIYSDRIFIDEHDRILKFWILPPHSNYLMSRWDFIPQETCFWRRSLMNKAGGIDSSYQFAMDYDLFERMMRIGKFKKVGGFLAAFREHENAKTTQLLGSTGELEIRRVRERLGMRGSLADFVIANLFGQLILQQSWLFKNLFWRFSGKTEQALIDTSIKPPVRRI